MINIKNVRTNVRYITVRKEWMLLVIYFLQIPKTYVPLRTHNRVNTNFFLRWFVWEQLVCSIFHLALTNRCTVPGSLRYSYGEGWVLYPLTSVGTSITRAKFSCKLMKYLKKMFGRAKWRQGTGIKCNCLLMNKLNCTCLSLYI